MFLNMVDFGCHGNVNFEQIICIFLFYALLDQIWIILNLCKLLICLFAESRYIALKMTFLDKFTDGSMILLPW